MGCIEWRDEPYCTGDYAMQEARLRATISKSRAPRSTSGAMSTFLPGM